jgi:hypothetical protein
MGIFSPYLLLFTFLLFDFTDYRDFKKIYYNAVNQWKGLCFLQMSPPLVRDPEPPGWGTDPRGQRNRK